MRYCYIAIACLLAGLFTPVQSIKAATFEQAPTVSDVIADSPEAAGIFVPSGERAARHVQSGVVCPLEMGDIALANFDIFASDGSDVGCVYAFPDTGSGDGGLTISVTKLRGGNTTASAFADLQEEVLRLRPSARLIGPAIAVSEALPQSALQDLQSGEYETSVDGKVAIDDVVVVRRKDWIIEVRSVVFTNASDPVLAVQVAGKLAIPLRATLEATSTAGLRTDSQ